MTDQEVMTDLRTMPAALRVHVAEGLLEHDALTTLVDLSYGDLADHVGALPELIARAGGILVTLTWDDDVVGFAAAAPVRDRLADALASGISPLIDDASLPGFGPARSWLAAGAVAGQWRGDGLGRLLASALMHRIATACASLDEVRLLGVVTEGASRDLLLSLGARPRAGAVLELVARPADLRHDPTRAAA